MHTDSDGTALICRVPLEGNAHLRSEHAAFNAVQGAIHIYKAAAL